MTKKEFNKDDPQLLQLAKVLADIGPNDFPEDVVDFGKSMLNNGPKSIPETIEHFEAHGYHSIAIIGALDGLRNFGIVEELEGERFQFSQEMKNLISELSPKAVKENDMNKNQKLDTNDESIRQLANTIATGVDADRDFESYICRTIFLAGPKTPDDLKFVFEDKSQYKEDMDKLEQRFDDMVDRGILQRVDDDGRVTISPDMLKLVVTANPGAMTQDQARPQGDTSENQASGKEDGGEKKEPRSSHSHRMQAEIDKVSSKENLELAKKLASRDDDKADDEVRLVRAMFDPAAEGVNFDTINSRFDASGNRAQTFMSLSKELQKRGVIQKLEQEGGNLYVVTMPFRALMEDAAHKARDVGRFDAEGADVSKAPHITIAEQGRQNIDISRKERSEKDEGRMDLGAISRSYQGNGMRPSSASMQREDGNRSEGDQGSIQRSVDLPQGKGRGRDQEVDDRLPGSGRIKAQGSEDRGQKVSEDFQIDPSVMNVSIMVFGVSLTMEQINTLYVSANDFLEYAERNPEVEPTFSSCGIAFDVDRAQRFVQHASHYGIIG